MNGLSECHTDILYGEYSLRLHHVETGQGTPHVFLHGWGQSSDAFLPLMESLSGVGRLIALDCPGFGQSALPPDDWDTVAYSECVLRWMDKHSIETCTLVGHSFGGRLSIRMAKRWPSRINAMVLIASAGLKRTAPPLRTIRIRMIQTLARTLGTLIPGGAGQRIKKRIYRWIASEDYLNAGPLRDTFVKVVNEDLAPLLEEIDIPALLVWGELDTATPPELGQRMHSLLPRSTYVEIPGLDHYTLLTRGRHQVAHHISKFCSTIGGKP